MNKFSVLSPCKINLNLSVHGKREDGYHSLTSVFQAVSLYDRIHITPDESREIKIRGDFDCAPEDNLIYKACSLFVKEAGIKHGYTFEIDKKVPQGGGIGGGSSNCAFVLRALNEYYNYPLTQETIMELGLSLGSDVPFFLSSPTALVQGRGELLSSLKTRTDYTILLINPGIHVSTARAFSLLAEKRAYTPKESCDINAMVSQYQKSPIKFWTLKNDFELVMDSDYTFISVIREALLASGADFVQMSGSGSTMYGLFTAQEDAEKAADRLSVNKMYKINIVRPIDSFPSIERF